MNWVDRLIMWLSPSWGQSRVRARVLTRHFEAASVGRRTSGWNRTMTDANSAASGGSLARLRAQARDHVRNNPWAREGLRVIKDDTVGWGIKPKATGSGAARAMELWRLWGETTQCDAAGRLDFYGLQALVMSTIVESGEVLVRRRLRRPEDGLAVPLQLEVLEPDYIDTSKDGVVLPNGGRITLGIETDAIGRRVAYWLFDQHPGGNTFVGGASRRIPADGILHIFDQERAQQMRGASWFASVDVRLHEFDEYEDATLMKQKIASCMAAFVTDLDGSGTALGEASTVNDQPIDSLEPGMILNLPVGKQVTVANPPQASDHQSFSTSQLRAIAAGLGIPYEALTGDFSQVNYSSARMAWNKYTRHIHLWRWRMLIPQFCAAAWSWMLDVAELAGERVRNAPAIWTPPPIPMLDPDKEGAATTRAVRSGQKTHDEMVREQGRDPDEFWEEYSDGLKRLDKYGLTLDSDPRKTNSSGQAQAAPAAPVVATDGGDEPAAAAGDSETAETDERYYAELRYAFDAAIASESRRADSAEARITAMREALAGDDEAIKSAIVAERDRADAERARADEIERNLRGLIAELDRARLANTEAHAREHERLMVENARLATELRLRLQGEADKSTAVPESAIDTPESPAEPPEYDDEPPDA